MRNYHITSVWGIPIRVNTSLLVFLPILAWLIGSGAQIETYAGFIEFLTGVGFDVEVLRDGYTPWVIGVLAAVGLFVSVTVHELGHSWVALRYGVEIESITLWILGGMAALKSIPREWDREFWIAIAGPVTSALLGGVCAVGLLVTPGSVPVARFVVGWLAVANVTLAVFNLLPAFPMDGGRILRALLARRRPYATATRTASRVGVVFAFLFVVVGVFTLQLILLLLGLFIYAAATTESRTVLLDELLEGITVGEIMTADPPTVDADTSVETFANRLLADRKPVHLVTDEDGAVVGVVALADLRGVAPDERADTPVSAVMREVPSVPSAGDAFDTLAELSGGGSTTALVEDRGSVVGVLSESDYAHAITVRKGFRSGL